MSEFINEETVMRFYIELLDRDEVAFLEGKDNKKEEIKGIITELLNEDTMNGKISVACKLWKVLFDAALSSISPNKKGYDKVFNYFDAYVEFEELIFASDSFYRDHTLHCIWVYFLGEYIRKNKEYERLFGDMKAEVVVLEGLLDTVKDAESLSVTDRSLLEGVIKLYYENERLFDAVYCVSAITHDLGYPLKKIDKINKSIKKVLPFFAINNFENFSFEYDNIQQGFIEEFIDCISRSLCINAFSGSFDNPIVNDCLNRIVKEKNGLFSIDYDEEDKLTKAEREEVARCCNIGIEFLEEKSARKHYLNDFENYQHGIMSAFILQKNLDVFQNVEYRQSGYVDINGIARKKTVLLVALNDIMQSISNHTSEGYKISSIGSISYLTFVDELEEFSRISRASQNREYVKEFCETSLKMDDEGWLNITFEFHNDDLDNLNPEISFKGRCKRFLTLFDIPNLSNNLKLRVSCVGRLVTDNNEYILEIANHYADIKVNGISQDIPKYLKSNQVFTKEEYMAMN